MGGLIHVALQSWALMATGRAPFTRFRTFVSGDQLGYAAIVRNVIDGSTQRFEPYTETGVNTYPRFYFVFVGVVGRLLGLQTVTAINLVSVALQFVMVALLGYLLVRVSGRWWAALLAPLPFLAGPMAWLVGPGWFIRLQSHALLWGPYGVLAPCNAETAGLSLGIIALSLLGLVWLRGVSRRIRVAASLTAAALIGLMANNHTYSFLMVVYLAAGMLAILGLYSTRSKTAVGLSAALVIGVYLAGPIMSHAAGQLATLVFGLLPFVPGLLCLARKEPVIVLWGGSIAAAVAVPQILLTLTDMKGGDPFLTYRVASNVDLGAVTWQTLASSLVVLVPLLSLLIIGLRRQIPALVALGGGTLMAALLLVSNDWWGANAEPYRFWIESFCLAAVVVLVGLTFLCSEYGHRRRALHTDAANADKESIPGRVVAGIVALTVLLYVAGLPDYVRWTVDPAAQDTWDPSNARMRATAKAAHAITGEGLLVPDGCINPQTAKVVTGRPITYYRLGMAWPAKRDAIDKVLEERKNGVHLETLLDADVRWVMTDSACSGEWLSDVKANLVGVSSVTYVPDPSTFAGAAPHSKSTKPQTITVWQVVK